jgi:hypothetical protein
MAHWWNSEAGKARMKSRVAPALYFEMEASDEIVAGASVCTGPSVWMDVLAPWFFLFAGLAVLARSNWIWHIPISGAVAGILWGVVIVLSLASAGVVLLRKQLFVAITKRRFICLRLNRSGYPDRLMFAMPISATSITCRGRSIKVTGSDGKTIRLNAFLHWRRDLDEVVAALEASGALVGASRRSSLEAMSDGDA